MSRAHTFIDRSKEQILTEYLPKSLKTIKNDQKAIPALAKDRLKTRAIEEVLPTLPTHHLFWQGDATKIRFLQPKTVHLVVTSPPYWTLKKYNDRDGQLGDISDYEIFLRELDKVWRRCFNALVPGGRLICVVGDVCLSRRKNNGRHTVVPLHASIQDHCRLIGFDNLAPIIWHKISNASYEAGGGTTFLGKPYEPNAVIKNDIEFILMERKPGGYRSPSLPERLMSVIPETKHKEWFQQIWFGLTGASTANHPAPYPLELAQRLIRMFSFVGDTVLDPFVGSGTTPLAAWQCGRNSINIEVDDEYLTKAVARFERSTNLLTSNHVVDIHK